MSQHDMDVANGPGATVRTDINGALQALASNSVGPLAPATTFPCQWWADTTAGRLKRRNIANTGWVDMGALDTQSFLLISGGTLTGPINDATPQTIASATLTDIGAATSGVVAISGTTAITGLGSIAAGARRSVRFLGSLLLTYNVTSLILPGNANITTAANDTADFLSLGGGNWICLSYTRNSRAAARSDLQLSDGWATQPIGVPIPIFDNLAGTSPPPTGNGYRYIKLTAADAYNSGAVVSESVSGSAPLVSATGVISVAGSPINGLTVRLINTERRVLRAGSAGVIEQDALQDHTHTMPLAGTDNTAGYNAFKMVANIEANGNTPSVNGANARVATETRVKNIGVTYYMRVL